MTKNYEATWEEQGAAPLTPATGKWKLFPKADGFYAVDDAGTVYGPFAVGTPTLGEIFLTGAGGWPSTANGCTGPTKVEWGTNDVDMYVLEFLTAVDKYAQWTLAMPSDWDGGTVTAVFYWTSAAGSGDVYFGLAGRSYADSDAIDQAFGTPQYIADTLLTSDDLHISGATAAITITGAGPSELVQLRVIRFGTDGSDTHSGTVRLIGIKVYYTKA
jgi:hypothetical protein